MRLFRVCCPLIPLLGEGRGYPEGYTLPKRQRHADTLDVPALCAILRDAVLFEEKEGPMDLAVVSVLSPYSTDVHVMITELSPGRYVPGPEAFTGAEFRSLTRLCGRVLMSMQQTKSYVRCAGYNWSPFSWGECEERNGCQSLMTKFHMMVWQWNDVVMENVDDIPAAYRELFGTNNYNVPFGKLVWENCRELAEKTGLFDTAVFGTRGLCVPFTSGKSIIDVMHNESFLQDIALSIEQVLERLSYCLTDFDKQEAREILGRTSERPLTDDELRLLRRAPNVHAFEDVVRRCNNDLEVEICSDLYESVVNRCGECVDNKRMWTKGFGYSLVICDSTDESTVCSGLYIRLHACCGPGGVAEALGCYLTRPEERVADEELMIKRNISLWDLSRALRCESKSSHRQS